mgnify:CR=1 FL=1
MKELILSKEEIETISKCLGEQISKDLQNEEKPPLFICVLKGALNFMAELLKSVTIPILTDFVQLSSYEGMKTTGKVNIKHGLETNPDGRTVVIVEDVVDTGLTMQALKGYLQKEFKPKKILVCSLFDKVNSRLVEAKVDYVGKILTENKFLIGFGLDYDELERNVPYVYTPSKEDLIALNAILEKSKQ